MLWLSVLPDMIVDRGLGMVPIRVCEAGFGGARPRTLHGQHDL